MKKLLWSLAVVLLVTWSAAAVAGESGKCTLDAQACLNHFAAKKDKGWSGIEADKTDAGQVVKKIVPGGPAAAAGLAEGDVLVALNGVKLTDQEAVKKAKGEWKVGQTVSYTVMRQGAEQEIKLTLAKLPEEVFAGMVGRHMLSDHMALAAEAKPAEVKATTAATTEKK